MPTRLYIVGRVWVEAPGGLLAERDLPRRQGRVLLVALAAERVRPVTRDWLVDVLWEDSPPPVPAAVLDPLLSKLRAVLARVLPGDAGGIEASGGCLQLRLPPDAVVDLERAVSCVDRAEGALRRGELEGAWQAAAVATAIARRPFLPGVDGTWVELRRRHLLDLHVRALTVLARVWTCRGDHVQSVRLASAVVDLDPFSEAGYRLLMRVLHAAGDRAGALRVYGRCRALLAEELDAEPSDATQDAYRAVLHARS